MVWKVFLSADSVKKGWTKELIKSNIPHDSSVNNKLYSYSICKNISKSNAHIRQIDSILFNRIVNEHCHQWLAKYKIEID